MKKSKRIRGLKRSILVATLMVGLTGGAAYAILQTQANTLTGNSISTATANLMISTDNLNFSSTHAGFDFNNIVPGGAAMPLTGNAFQLKNAGGTALALKFMVTGTPTNSSNIDLSKVNVLLTTIGSNNPPQSFTLQSLIASASTGGVAIAGPNLDLNTTMLYKLQVSMTADAITGQSASLGNVDFSFSGLVQ